MCALPKYAIIVAGGSGTRMNSDIPKQFLLLRGEPVLCHTIRAFYNYSAEVKVILVLPEGQFSYWDELCTTHNFTLKAELAKGGNTRWQSVKNGLDKITEPGLVAIHDGVRPLVTCEVIDLSFRTAAQKGNAVASVSLKDSIRSISTSDSKSEDRSLFRLIQTPQTFQTELIKSAYSKTSNESRFTDDASVLEFYGEKICLIEGSYSNLKITTPEDLIIAESLLKL